MKTYLAFYKGTKSLNPKSVWLDRLICLIDGSDYSHVEFVVKRQDGLYDCYSASFSVVVK